jgi:DeoR family transcriptional regulator, aga operon transcriptional repressor
MYLNGYVGARELAASMDVDTSTIRRDLHALAAEGLLERTHGGARVPPGATDVPYAVKQHERGAAKQAIGRAAAALVHDGDSVMLDSGSTVYEVAVHLRERRELTIIVNDLRIAQLVAEFPSVRLLVPGGELLTSNYALVSDQAVAFVRQLRVDWAFIGADAIDVQTGITNTNTLEVPLKRAMLASARHAVVVADSAKFGVRTLVRVAHLDELERVITDDELDADAVASCGGLIQLVPLQMRAAPADRDAATIAAT